MLIQQQHILGYSHYNGKSIDEFDRDEFELQTQQSREMRKHGEVPLRGPPWREPAPARLSKVVVQKKQPARTAEKPAVTKPVETKKKSTKAQKKALHDAALKKFPVVLC